MTTDGRLCELKPALKRVANCEPVRNLAGAVRTDVDMEAVVGQVRALEV